tara:strand:- start:5322 stop:6041 length:720 start_codon:yes stop_codon:yes gene_type:complete
MIIDINKIKENPDNPRTITEDKFKKLVKSLKELPDMINVRPIVIDENMIVLGGNMRLRAMKQAGIKKVPVHQVENWSDEQKKQFIIKDNIGYGTWDWDLLANEWDLEQLENWDLDIPNLYNDEKEYYTAKIETPEYKPNNIKPKPKELFDNTKQKKLLDKINNAKIDKETKDFLIQASNRHLVFDYSKIADFYAHSNKETQKLMEDSALVIIDFNKAISNGYVELTESIAKAYKKNGIL